MSNSVKLLSSLMLVVAIFMIEILVNLLMPIAWLVLIGLVLLIGYIIKQLYDEFKAGN
jgi:hypothetical protein